MDALQARSGREGDVAASTLSNGLGKETILKLYNNERTLPDVFRRMG